jgi:hypothetical protein
MFAAHDPRAGRGAPGGNRPQPSVERRLGAMFERAGSAFATDPTAGEDETGLSADVMSQFNDKELRRAYGHFAGLVLGRQNLQPVGRRSGENMRGDNQALRTLGRLLTQEIVERDEAGSEGLDPDELYQDVAYGLGALKYSVHERPDLADKLPIMWHPQLAPVREGAPGAHLNDTRAQLRQQVFRQRAIEMGVEQLQDPNVADLLAFPEP